MKGRRNPRITTSAKRGPASPAIPKKASPCIEGDDDVELVNVVSPWYRMPPDSTPMDPDNCYFGFDLCDNTAGIHKGGDLIRVISVVTAGNENSVAREAEFHDQLLEILGDRIVVDNDSYDMVSSSSSSSAIAGSAQVLHFIRGTVSRAQAVALAVYLRQNTQIVLKAEGLNAVTERCPVLLTFHQVFAKDGEPMLTAEMMPLKIVAKEDKEAESTQTKRQRTGITNVQDIIKDAIVLEEAVLVKKAQTTAKKTTKKKKAAYAKKFASSKHAMATRRSARK